MASNTGSSADRRLGVLAGHLTPPPASSSPQHSSSGSGRPAPSRSPPVSPCLVRKPVVGAGPSETGLLQGQVAIITGAGQGLGGAAARLFAREGALVVACDLDSSKLRALTSEIQEEGGEAVGVAGDVTNEHFPEVAVMTAVRMYGRVDIIVNNAGFTWDGMLHKTSKEQWEAMLAVHCTAPFKMIQVEALGASGCMRDAARAEIEETGQAAPRYILNISSVSGTHGSIGQANYSTAKMGVVGLTKTVAKEWGPYNIRCNCIAFGMMDTRLTRPKEGGETISVGGQEVKLGIPGQQKAQQGLKTAVPLGRMGTVEEGAAAMLMMVSPMASYVTGQVLEVNGGLYM